MTPHTTDAYLDAIEEEISRALTAPDTTVAPLYGMMRYHLGWLDRNLQPVTATRGKRVRPLLCLLACEAAGGDWRKALPAAAALELIHNFSLLHDDIEDQSETRRHRPTVWALWGVAQALNTGDAMWAIARLSGHRLADCGHAPETVLRALRLLDDTCLALCTGQYLDIRFEGDDAVTLGEYERMIAGKTAALLSAAPACGALLSGAPDGVVDALAAYGRELGLTFQIVDDILGIWGEPRVTGKSAASDVLTRKKTLPVLHAMQWEAEQGYTDLATLYARGPLTEEDVPRALALFERSGARAYAEERARAHQERKLGHLRASGLPAERLAPLEALAMSLLKRES